MSEKLKIPNCTTYDASMFTRLSTTRFVKLNGFGEAQSKHFLSERLFVTDWGFIYSPLTIKRRLRYLLEQWRLCWRWCRQNWKPNSGRWSSEHPGGRGQPQKEERSRTRYPRWALMAEWRSFANCLLNTSLQRGAGCPSQHSRLFPPRYWWTRSSAAAPPGTQAPASRTFHGRLEKI